MENDRIINVLLPFAFDRGFDYRVPDGMTLAPGDYVFVPFGSKEAIGVVWGEGTWEDKSKLKTVARHAAHLPPMSETLRRLIDWMAWYTMAPRGNVLKLALPFPEVLAPPKKKKESGIRNPVPSNTIFPIPNSTLSPDQQHAAQVIGSRLEKGFSVTLLDGVTGSGKTEVYFDAIAKTLESKQQTLILLPEISLTVQFLSRFEKRFGFAPDLWHSEITKAKKRDLWQRIATGDARVIAGARSALFLPFKNLSLITVDEEHDHSYKQEDGVIYQGRDMAVARAREEAIPIILASATPSLETTSNVEQGRYHLVHLPARFAEASLPTIRAIDLRKENLPPRSFLSPTLKDALRATIARGEQAMLFLNRRGYAPLMLCKACGHRFQCPDCSSWLVVHQGKGKNRLTCHHCGFGAPVPPNCPACQATETLIAYGPGVERVTEEVGALLPDARIAMMTSDLADSPKVMEQIITDMEQEKLDILVGTQMIAKGHHFGKLSLVGVIDADMGLVGGDLRATERTYHLLHQLAGRAGREKTEGLVLLQTYAADHPVIEALVSGNRERFMQVESDMRKAGGLPPYGRLVSLLLEGRDERKLAEFCQTLARAIPQSSPMRVLGPAPAPIFRLRGKSRYRFLVKADRSVRVQDVIRDWLARVEIPSSIRLKIDVDPYSFL